MCVCFDIVRIDNRRRIVINAKGRLIKRAFEWKAYENLSNEAIRSRLAELGLKVNHQRISETFRNPFYCGLMAHNMLEGQVVQGNQEKLVSREVFLKVNGLLDQNSHGYSLNEENADIPLKRFLTCGHCGKPLRGYLVRKKNINYYKCSTKACCNNKNAEDLNSRFVKILEAFRIDLAQDFLIVLKKQIVATFNQMTNSKEETFKELQSQHKEINIKINRLEERYIEEEVGSDLYKKYSKKYSQEKSEIERNLMSLSSKKSNLEKCVDLALEYAVDLPLKWVSADYHTKQQMQILLFPQGISYSKKTDESRTTMINSVFLYIAYFQQLIGKKKRGIPELSLDYASFADSVESIGGKSNFYEHCEAIVNFEKVVNNKIEGQYRKKKKL